MQCHGCFKVHWGGWRLKSKSVILLLRFWLISRNTLVYFFPNWYSTMPLLFSWVLMQCQDAPNPCGTCILLSIWSKTVQLICILMQYAWSWLDNAVLRIIIRRKKYGQTLEGESTLLCPEETTNSLINQRDDPKAEELESDCHRIIRFIQATPRLSD